MAIRDCWSYPGRCLHHRCDQTGVNRDLGHHDNLSERITKELKAWCVRCVGKKGHASDRSHGVRVSETPLPGSGEQQVRDMRGSNGPTTAKTRPVIEINETQLSVRS